MKYCSIGRGYEPMLLMRDVVYAMESDGINGEMVGGFGGRQLRGPGVGGGAAFRTRGGFFMVLAALCISHGLDEQRRRSWLR